MSTHNNKGKESRTITTSHSSSSTKSKTRTLIKDSILCSVCGVYIPKDRIKKHRASDRCKELKRGKAIRDKAMGIILSNVNSLFKGDT